MLKASWLVPLGTPETVKAGELDPQAVAPDHEKLRPMARAFDGSAPATTNAVTMTTRRVWICICSLQISQKWLKNPEGSVTARQSNRPGAHGPRCDPRTQHLKLMESACQNLLSTKRRQRGAFVVRRFADDIRPAPAVSTSLRKQFAAVWNNSWMNWSALVAIVAALLSFIGANSPLQHEFPSHSLPDYPTDVSYFPASTSTAVAAKKWISVLQASSTSRKPLILSTSDGGATESTPIPGIFGWLPLNATTTDYLATYEAADAQTLRLLLGVDGQVLLAKDANRIYSTTGAQFQGIDPKTFSIVGYAVPYGILYARDQTHAYWFTAEDWGVVQGAQPSLFRTSSAILPYATDDTSIFYINLPVPGADPSTFKSFPLSWYAKDRNHVFSNYGYGSYVKVVPGADPNTFTPFPAVDDGPGPLPDFSIYGWDASAIYCQGSVLFGADLSTFAPTDATDAKDKSHTYIECIDVAHNLPALQSDQRFMEG